MANNVFRRLFQSLGFDIHRHRKSADSLSWLSTIPFGAIVDVGANTGQFYDEVHSLFPHTPFYAIEPVKEHVRVLQEKALRHANLTVLPYAAGDRDETETIHINAYSPGTSLLPALDTLEKTFPHAREIGTQTIEIRTLDELLRDIRENNLLINIDVQGYEEKVIKGGQHSLPKARVVIIESSFIPLYKDQSLFHDVYEGMHALGFVYKGSFRQKMHPVSGEIIAEDALFLRAKDEL
jgi:FkbM family methyltransferase